MFASARFRLLLGATIISFSAVLVRLTEVPPTTSGFYRTFIGGTALCLYLLLARRRVRLTRGALLALAFAAVWFTADLWFWHRSIILVGPGLSTLLASLQVFMVTIIGALFLKQPATVRQIVSIPLAVIGLALVVGIDWSVLPDDYRLGVWFGIATAVSYSLYLLAMRRAQQDTTTRVPIAEVALMSMLTAGTLAIIAGVEGTSLAIPTWRDAGWLACYGLIAHVVGWLLITSSLTGVSPAVLGLSLLLQPLLSFVWDIVFFDRGITPLELAGAALTLTAIFIGSYRRRRPRGPGATIRPAST